MSPAKEVILYLLWRPYTRYTNLW